MVPASLSPQRTVAEINITPLVDVMLVLLVIFMVAAPVLTRRMTVDLPRPGPTPPTPSVAIDLRIDPAGQLAWNGVPTPLSALPAMLEAEAQRDPAHPPLLRIAASGDADYGAVARVLAAARNAGVDRIGFVGD